MRHLFSTLAIGTSILLSGCAGFKPMHATPSGKIAISDMAVNVSDGRDEGDRAVGFIIRQRLAERMSVTDKPAYRLDIQPAETRFNLGLTDQDRASRFDSRVSAGWILYRISDGKEIAKGKSEGTSTYSTDQDPFRLQATAEAAKRRAARGVADDILFDVATKVTAVETP